ncbi:MAG: M24 family metallopeptidase [Acidobacteriota bacterium]|nr:M24 family metallopeptidase [Acidobacteriota bacterium]
MDLTAIQQALREQGLDGWLFYDHHYRDEIAYSILGLGKMHVTRRWFYLVPATGEPIKLNHRVEPRHLEKLPGVQQHYGGWRELRTKLAAMLKSCKRVAMQYSPNNDIMYVSLVDGGMLELIRSFGVEVVTSADLVSRFEAVLSEEQIFSHFAARDSMDRIMAAAFKEIGQRVRHGGWDEWGVRQWLGEAFARENLITDDLPIVGANANAGNPHYEPTAEVHGPIREGDLVLLDMWAKKNTPGAVYYDITWTGVIGTPSEKQQKVFEIVRDARKAGAKKVADAFAANKRIEGWEVDDATRWVINNAGYGEWFVHRTGHSIGINVHGNGANMDNLETHDTRQILPNTLFSVEPGIYLPEFGVRSEVDVLVHNGRAQVTGAEQEELVRI